jgi:hypothetical protein
MEPGIRGAAAETFLNLSIQVGYSRIKHCVRLGSSAVER